MDNPRFRGDDDPAPGVNGYPRTVSFFLIWRCSGFCFLPAGFPGQHPLSTSTRTTQMPMDKKTAGVDHPFGHFFHRELRMNTDEYGLELAGEGQLEGNRSAPPIWLSLPRRRESSDLQAWISDFAGMTTSPKGGSERLG